ncbi:hypothetical protein EDC18_10480 [Natranaerovirga pectinivora]|uniref:SprT-like family protein n=1 Tax=Natranaerovirga pectinivora TaxID=682400 RepID=A0A4R3MNI7_9FIRM|nr:hypothetical protein [Natranaerovirga pectinivora]TCT14930.1 hypothetical protein EDC18_10480 [Natranaerovirga pectinivora]
MLNITYNESNITEKRKKVASKFFLESLNIRTPNINKLSNDDIRILFDFYDKIFFESWFKKHFKGQLLFSLSNRMTKSAGLTMCPKNISVIKAEDVTIEIRIGVNFFLKYNALKSEKSVCGIKTNNSFEALQLVFEHELCHVIEFLCFYKSSCKGQRFKELAFNLFGHTSSYHQLPTNREIVGKSLGLHLGDMVSFTFEGYKKTGVIYRINKNATVMVKDTKGQFVDNNGSRYSKYYVPVNLLSK